MLKKTQAELYRILHPTVKQKRKKKSAHVLLPFNKMHVLEVGRWYVPLKWNRLFFHLRKYLGLRRREQFRILLHDSKFHLVLLGF
jgi:hypothetical protein